MPLAMSEEHGHNLQTVQMLLKKNQVTNSKVAHSGSSLVGFEPLHLCFYGDEMKGNRRSGNGASDDKTAGS